MLDRHALEVKSPPRISVSQRSNPIAIDSSEPLSSTSTPFTPSIINSFTPSHSRNPIPGIPMASASARMFGNPSQSENLQNRLVRNKSQNHL